MSTVEAIPTRANFEAFIRRAGPYWREVRCDLRNARWPPEDVNALLGGVEIAITQATKAIDAGADDETVSQCVITLADIGKATARAVSELSKLDPIDRPSLVAGRWLSARAIWTSLWIALGKRFP